VPPQRKLLDHQGRPVELGPQFAAGGEGVVFTLAGNPSLLAKLYHRPPDPAKAEKLRWMVQGGDAGLCKFAAWPVATLHETAAGPPLGFLMPRFNGCRPIHTLYSPAHRRTTFPQADWSFLIHTAMNCAAAFDTVHARGHVIGDVNQSNVLVSDKALICLIDCDSFQVHAGGCTFPCEVGVSPYTPSELQGQNFRNLVRTPNHDRFGLAVLVFHLLFMGRHPFAGRFLGSGEMPLEKAIAEYRFVYSAAAPVVQMAPPPHALQIRDASPELARLFELAFDRGAEADARPTAAQWQAALAAFQKQMRTCPNDPGHKIPAHLLECPWCAIMQGGGPNFFLGVALGGMVFTLDTAFAARIGERIDSVPRRPFTFVRPALPAVARTAPSGLRSALLLRRTANVIGYLSLAVFAFWVMASFVSCEGWTTGAGNWGLLLTWLVLRVLRSVIDQMPSQAAETKRKQALQTAHEDLQAAEAEWQQLAARYRTDFDKMKRKLKELRDRYKKLQSEYEAERTRLDSNKEEYFRGQFLRTKFLSDHKIPGIGPNREVLLASYGIETAFDIDKEKLAVVRGVGPVLTKKLLDWRKRMAAEFRFDPQAVVPEPELRSVVLKYKQLEEGLRTQLQRGAAELEAMAGRTEQQLRGIVTRIEALMLRVAQAESDLR
jgi:DNA-binding helix-hairpin-helix protein with protein kinase domain